MLPDWVSNSGPLTYESGALPIAPRGPAIVEIGTALALKIYIWVYITNVNIIKCVSVIMLDV